MTHANHSLALVVDLSVRRQQDGNDDDGENKLYDVFHLNVVLNQLNQEDGLPYQDEYHPHGEPALQRQ